MREEEETSSEEYEEEDEDEEESEEEAEDEDDPGDDDEQSQDGSSSQTSEMQEDELAVSRPRGKPTRNALVADSDGAYRHAHELGADVDIDRQRRSVMQSSLFRMPEESAAMRAIDAQASNASKGVFLNRKHSRDSDGESMRQDWRIVSIPSLFL